jgi:hypothetical protein
VESKRSHQSIMISLKATVKIYCILPSIGTGDRSLLKVWADDGK